MYLFSRFTDAGVAVVATESREVGSHPDKNRIPQTHQESRSRCFRHQRPRMQCRYRVPDLDERIHSRDQAPLGSPDVENAMNRFGVEPLLARFETRPRDVDPLHPGLGVALPIVFDFTAAKRTEPVEVDPEPAGRRGATEWCFHKIYVIVKFIKPQGTPLQQSYKTLLSAWLTEIQAISIYETECAILSRTPWTHARRESLEICRDILKEEMGHSNDLLRFIHPSPGRSWNAILQKLGGAVVGAVLAVLPARASWRIHVWAERQASAIYRNARFRLRSLPKPLQDLLAHAESQEAQHAARFEKLLSSERAP